MATKSKQNSKSGENRKKTDAKKSNKQLATVQSETELVQIDEVMGPIVSNPDVLREAIWRHITNTLPFEKSKIENLDIASDMWGEIRNYIDLESYYNDNMTDYRIYNIKCTECGKTSLHALKIR